ncbi:hypothetical protein [Hymenobacter arizonensis]|uniref:Uncharacterized protein n=1 Tax=Hymenobacter arizonensis TaxID=1227077 RepID=A0A1I6BN75_HYMAR|nr:hypothetical protein [Hymenobacter arizonensis]SFQ82371.1 hypothetical protein SAMN04515668_4796 [Hymenobacter arizonensis]
MRRVLRVLWALLAWAWLVCAVLTVLELKDVVQFATPQVGRVVRAATWLLVFPASGYFGWSRWLGGSLWAGLAGAVAVGGVTFFMGGILLITGLVRFFGGGSAWHTTHVHTRRGGVFYVQQATRDQAVRDVVLLPLTPWLNVPLPPAWFAVQRWAPVHKAFAYFGPDSTQQAREDQRADRFRYCTRQNARFDSLDRQGLLPPQVLPAATQQGAGTFGCRLGPRVWSVPLRPAPEPIDCSTTWSGAWTGRDDSTHFYLNATRIYEHLQLVLPYPLPRAPGTYPATLYVMWPWQSRGPQHPTWRSAPRSVRVTLTRLDTVAHVIAGTFTGTLYWLAPDEEKPGQPVPYRRRHRVPVRQGRFDLRYTPGIGHFRP